MPVWEASNELNLFPVKVREYHKPKDDMHKYLLEFFETYPQQLSNFPEGVITSRPDLHKCDNEDVRNLMGWFRACLDEYHNQYQLYCDNLEISACWFNKAPAQSGVGHPLHRHPMSYVSAVYYITEGAPTAFDDPCTPRVYDTLELHQQEKMADPWGICETVSAEPGKLIIFPSWLRHFSGRHLEDFDRWTISFNAFPNGKCNTGPFQMPQLEVKVL